MDQQKREVTAWDMERGSLLKAARIQAGMTQATLADRLGVTQATVSNWERGVKHAQPSDEKISIIQEVLGHSLSEELVDSDIDSFTDLSLWLKGKLEDSKLGVEAIAGEIKVSVPTLYNIMRGSVTSPQKSTLRKLYDYFGEPPQEVKEETAEARSIGKLGEFEEFSPHDSSTWPAGAGVYILYDITDRPIYVGKSKNSVANRLHDHQSRFWYRRPLVEKAVFIAIDDAELVLDVENLLIKFLRSHAVMNKQGVVRDPAE